MPKQEDLSKMKIVFINPCLGGDFSALDIAITSLAAYINKKTMHNAEIIDLTFHRRGWREFLKRKIKEKMPDAIGISCSTMYMQYVKEIMKEVKNNLNCPIILGGYHPSLYPDNTLRIPECNAVCIGDGEKPLNQYLDNLSTGRSLEGITGIWSKENGRVIKNPIGYFYENLNDLPAPDWSLWEDLDKYFYHLGMLYFIGSRGCPYQCSFCDAHGIANAVRGQYFRMRNPRDYVHEIVLQWEKYKDRDFRLAQLFDPVFSIDSEWVDAFCNEYKALELYKKLKFSVFSRIDHLDEHKIKTLAEAGCGVIRVGVESGDQFMRSEIYKKKISDEIIRKVFRLLREAGIATTAYYMLGGPGESRNTIKKTIDFSWELDGERSVFFIYKPFTQEGIKQVYDYGGKIDNKRWQKADNITFNAVIYTRDLSPGQVERYQVKAYLFTFFRRWFKILRRQKYRYFVYLFTYLLRGIKDGLNLIYLFTYFHVYGYDNIDK